MAPNWVGWVAPKWVNPWPPFGMGRLGVRLLDWAVRTLASVRLRHWDTVFEHVVGLSHSYLIDA